MENQHHARLTSSEIASLWTQFQLETMSLCVNRYMLNTIEDKDIKAVFEYAIHLGEQHKKSVETLFTKEKFPIPHGFTEEDVHLNAPRLFSEQFCLFYLHQMTIHGLSSYGVSLPVSTRIDIRNYFVECTSSVMEVYNRTIEILLKKGLYQRPPYISTPDEIDFIKDKSFMNGWLGERRPLNVIEISEIYFNLKKTLFAKTMLMGYIQVTQTKEIKKLFSEAMDLASKHIEELGAKLQMDNLPGPTSYEDQLTNSTVSPFSDRLMMYHLGFLFQTALAYYGSGMAVSMRPDVALQYEKLIIEVFKGAGQWAGLMIKQGWMEQPPQADDRKALAHSNNEN